MAQAHDYCRGFTPALYWLLFKEGRLEQETPTKASEVEEDLALVGPEELKLVFLAGTLLSTNTYCNSLSTHSYSKYVHHKHRALHLPVFIVNVH